MKARLRCVADCVVDLSMFPSQIQLSRPYGSFRLGTKKTRYLWASRRPDGIVLGTLPHDEADAFAQLASAMDWIAEGGTVHEWERCAPRRGRHARRIEMTERPDRYRNAIVPHIYIDGASDGIAFYKRAFGAVELFR